MNDFYRDMENRVASMTSENKKLRAQIDSESVRYVMVANGGGSVALLALLPKVIGTPLIFGLLLTLLIWLLGLTSVLVHSSLRRRCNEATESRRLPEKSVFGIKPREPWVCWCSWKFFHSAIFAFVAGGLIMVGFSFLHIDELSSGTTNTENQVRTIESPSTPEI